MKLVDIQIPTLRVLGDLVELLNHTILTLWISKIDLTLQFLKTGDTIPNEVAMDTLIST